MKIIIVVALRGEYMTGGEQDDGGDGFTVPEAPCRPGEKSNFEPWTYEPGDLNKPNHETCTPEETIDHAASKNIRASAG